MVTAFASYRIWQVGLRDDTRPADAIVVLGAAQYDGTPSPVLAARLHHAVALFDDGVAPLLVMTGGGQPGDRTTEAAVGRAYALAAGVPDSAIVVEDASRNTVESLEAVAAILKATGATTVVLVSDRTHMLRALRIATDAGLDARSSPAPDSPTEADVARRSEAMLHELAGLAIYYVGFGG